MKNVYTLYFMAFDINSCAFLLFRKNEHIFFAETLSAKEIVWMVI